MKNILLLIYILTAGISGYSQEKSTAELKMNYEFFSTGKTNKLHFTCLIPKNIDHAQNVIKTEFMPQPVKVFNENGNNYAEFIIDSFSEKKEISVNVTIEIYKSDFNTIKMNQTILSKFSVPTLSNLSSRARRRVLRKVSLMRASFLRRKAQMVSWSGWVLAQMKRTERF